MTGVSAAAPSGDEPQPSRLRWMATVLVLGVLTVVCSAGMIGFNKFLIHRGRFPYATPLMCVHMLVSAFCSGVLYYFFPSMYPSLSDPEKRKMIDMRLYCRGIIPIGAFFVGQLVLSNTAYLYCNVAFLQMMKEGNIVLVYGLSVAVALEIFKFRNVAVLCCIIVSTLLCVEGEVHFSLPGFFIQLSSQLNESMKIVLQGLLLTGAAKMDALTYLLLMTPVAFAFLACLLIVLYISQWSLMPTPAPHEIAEWLPYILANACLAFAVNVVNALFMKNSSPVAYMALGVIKDACIVLGGAAAFHESLTRMQCIGFILQLIFILTWMSLKTFPEYFEDGVFDGFARLLTGRAPLPKKGEAGYGATAAPKV